MEYCINTFLSYGTGTYAISRAVTNQIIKVIDNIQQDNAIVVIVHLNPEVMCIILYFFFFFFLKLNNDLSYAI